VGREPDVSFIGTKSFGESSRSARIPEDLTLEFARQRIEFNHFSKRKQWVTKNSMLRKAGFQGFDPILTQKVQESMQGILLTEPDGV
jgi:hypothetical protein